MSDNQTMKKCPLFWIGIAGLACLILPLYPRGFECFLSLALQTLFGHRRLLGITQFAFILPTFVPSALLIILNFKHDGTMKTINLNVLISAIGSVYSLFIFVIFPYLFYYGIIKFHLDPIIRLLQKFIKDPAGYIIGSTHMGLAFIALFIISLASLVVALIERADPFAGARGKRG